MPSIQQQKALFLTKNAGEFVVRDTEIYKPGQGQLLVKIHATSLNPIDWKILRIMGEHVKTYPTILGSDIAGIVEEVGEGVKDFEKGDRVFAHGVIDENESTGFQQYTLTRASATAKIPSRFSYDEAAAIPLVLTTAYVGLYNVNPFGLGFTPLTSKEARGKYANTPIVVLGGSSSVGQIVLQLVKISGFSPVITTASTKHTELLQSLGATHVLDRKLSSASLSEKIKEITGGKPIEFVYDSISSSETVRAGLDILSAGGQLVSVNGMPAGVEVPKDKAVHMVWAGPRMPPNEKLVSDLYHDVISELMEDGLIKPNNIEILPRGLEGIIAGLARLEADTVSGLKLVAHPQETD